MTGDSRSEDNGPFRVAPRVNVPGYSLIIPSGCARSIASPSLLGRSYADYSWTENARAHSGKRRLNPRNEVPEPRSHRSSATSQGKEREREKGHFSEPRIRDRTRRNSIMEIEWSCLPRRRWFMNLIRVEIGVARTIAERLLGDFSGCVARGRAIRLAKRPCLRAGTRYVLDKRRLIVKRLRLSDWLFPFILRWLASRRCYCYFHERWSKRIFEDILFFRRLPIIRFCTTD